MLELPNYTIAQKAFEGTETIVYRGRRDADGAPIAIKVTRNDYPTARQLGRLRREFGVLREIHSVKGVGRAYALEKLGRGLALVMEDLGASSLRDLIARHKLDLPAALRLAVTLVETLDSIHRLGIIHKDIKPHNVMIDAATGAPTLIDFGIAARLLQETPQAASATTLEGTLAYLSPEQTGRMNRAVDLRTDLYSLGATLYEVLTGAPPFTAQDPTELIHCHIARTPTPPHERRAEIPRVVSDVVMKLLAKTPEDRYQSARGLKADLAECLRQWTTEGRVAPFALGRRDHPAELRIPQKLYGRTREVAELLAAFERAQNGAPSLLVIAGSSGVGKSALVNEIHKPIAQQGGYFAHGKFDLLSRDAPLAPLALVFRGLLQQILTESSSALEGWKLRLLDAVGVNGRILCELAPELGLILGPQPEVPALGPNEAQNRFDLLVQRFLGAFARPEHPLCIFLDDLQWADPTSLRLLRMVLSDPETKHLLVIGAYRDNEVDAAHLLSASLDELRKKGAALTELKLTPLDLGTVRELLAETLRAAPDEVDELAAILFDKTRGNPFFLGQLLKTLREEGIVRFEAITEAFTWDVARARAAMATDNVVDLMVSKLRRLPPDTQRVLERAACIGHSFELGMLATIAARPAAEVAAALWSALKDGLVVPEGGDYRLLDESAAEVERAEELQVSYRFLHDRVQQAAYALIAEEQRAPLHLSIGRLLLSRGGGAPLDDDLLSVVRQLNLGAREINDDSELRAVAELDLLAGRKAKRATAYQAAAGFFAAGIALLGEGGFAREYDLAAALHLEGAESAYLSGAVERAEALFEALLPRVKTALERARVHHLRVVLYATRGKYAEAVAEGRAGLRLLGITLPEGEEIKPAAAMEFREVAENLGGRRPEDLLDAKPMVDPTLRFSLELLGELTVPVYHVDLTLGAVLMLKQVNLSLKHGHTDLSAFAYATYGFLLSSELGKPAEGYAFSRLALALSEQLPDPVVAGKVGCAFAAGSFRTQPLRAAIPHYERALEAARASGDFVYVGTICHNLCLTKIGAGIQLAELREEVDKHLALARQIRNAVSSGILTIAKQVFANLEGRTFGRDTLSDDSFDEEAFFRFHGVVQGQAEYYYWIFKLLIHSIYGDYPRAALAAEEAERRSPRVFSSHFTTQVPFRACLALAALPAADALEQASARRAAIDRHRSTIAGFAEHCPANYQHQMLLIDAEIARLDGHLDTAFRLYDEAIALAAAHDFPQDEALANELAAKLYLALGRPKAARGYMTDAYRGYLHWGATAKAEALEREHGALLSLAAAREQGSHRRSASRGSTTNGTTLFSQTTAAAVRDAAIVVRATQAITGELALPKLLEQLSKLVLENAGAQRGALLLSRDGQLFVEASFGVDPATLAVGPSAPLEGHADIAASVALFVARTRTPLVLDDARLDPRFAADPHIEADGVRSILCLPLVHQQRLGGLLYLEHRDAAAVFNATHVELLALFSSQAAVALENARLVADVQAANERAQAANARLEAEVAERTVALRQSNRELHVELGQRAQAERERAALQEKMLQAQRDRLLEMSTPLIPITNRIVVMPLIGTMDQERAAQVLDAALKGAQHHRARVVILDVTGLRHVDTHVISTLLGTASALRLLGAQAVLTGVRPEMAQAMVVLGANLGAIVTRGTLQSGIAYALERSGEADERRRSA